MMQSRKMRFCFFHFLFVSSSNSWSSKSRKSSIEFFLYTNAAYVAFFCLLKVNSEAGFLTLLAPLKVRDVNDGLWHFVVSLQTRFHKRRAFFAFFNVLLLLLSTYYFTMYVGVSRLLFTMLWGITQRSRRLQFLQY